MLFTINPFTGKLDVYECDIGPSGDVEFLAGDTGTTVPPTGGGVITIEGGTGIDVIEDAGSNKLTVQINGGEEGTGTTSGAVTTDLITYDLDTTPGTYLLKVDVVGFDSTTPGSMAYRIRSGIRTTGAAGVEINTESTNVFEEADFTDAKAEIIVSANNAIVRVTGVAGKDISWKATLTTTFYGG